MADSETRASHSVFEVFVAVLAAVAVVAGLYAFGLAIADDDNTDDTAATPAVAAQDAASAEPAAAEETHAHEAETVDDRGFAALSNGEEHGHEFTQALTAEERTELARQLALAREVALQYPTLADAEAAGMWRAGPFSPGLGTHMINTGGALGNVDGVMDDDDIRSPLALMYDGVEPTSRVAGLFYGASTSEPPEGFAGAYDTWH